MIEETGQVIRTEGSHAWVRTQRKSTCGQCAARKGCGTSVFAKVLGNRLVEFRAINEAGAEEGDDVVLGLHESVLLKSALLVYILPLLSMFFAALVSEYLNSGLGLALSSGSQVLFAICGLAAGFVFVKFFAARHNDDTRYQPVILRRVTLMERNLLDSV